LLTTFGYSATLDGAEGDDKFEIRHMYDVTGVLSVDGGDGLDTLDFSWALASTGAVKIDLSTNQVQSIRAKLTMDVKNVENVFGTAGDDALTGDAHANHLNGSGGDDRLTGGGGADTLTGGPGADTFVFAAGDTVWSINSEAGLDVIQDWSSDDKLSFGPRSGSVDYGEQTTSSWIGALTIAPQAMATRHLSYMAIQVGNDTYVFAAQPGTSTGQIENVVKLVGVGLDSIGAENFI
jgi:Ca2+-binding RTX toxin-like protein